MSPASVESKESPGTSLGQWAFFSSYLTLTAAFPALLRDHIHLTEELSNRWNVCHETTPWEELGLFLKHILKNLCYGFFPSPSCRS